MKKLLIFAITAFSAMSAMELEQQLIHELPPEIWA